MRRATSATQVKLDSEELQDHEEGKVNTEILEPQACMVSVETRVLAVI